MTDLIPVNPVYVFEETKVRNQYVNPVVLNNWLIRISNNVSVTSDKLTQIIGRMAKLKADLREAEADLDDFEGAWLAAHPPGPQDRKTNKLLEAYIRSLAGQQPDGGQMWHDLRKRIRTIQEQIIQFDGDKDACYARLEALRTQSDNIRSHLSYVKAQHGN